MKNLMNEVLELIEIKTKIKANSQSNKVCLMSCLSTCLDSGKGLKEVQGYNIQLTTKDNKRIKLMLTTSDNRKGYSCILNELENKFVFDGCTFNLHFGMMQFDITINKVLAVIEE
jgi:hypothetical protein